MKIIKKAGVLLLASLLFTSCFDITAKISVNQDNSGTAQIEYQVSRMIDSMVQAGDTKSVLPLPINEEDLKLRTDLVEGIELLTYTLEETEDSYLINAEFSFQDAEVFMNELFGIGYDMNSAGGNQVLEMTVYQGTTTDIDELSLSLMENIFPESKISLEYTFPSPVLSVSEGEILPDGRTAVYSQTLINLMNSYNPVVWSITW